MDIKELGEDVLVRAKEAFHVGDVVVLKGALARVGHAVVKGREELWEILRADFEHGDDAAKTLEAAAKVRAEADAKVVEADIEKSVQADVKDVKQAVEAQVAADAPAAVKNVVSAAKRAARKA